MEPENPKTEAEPGVVCRSFVCTTRSINEARRTVDVVMSTDTIDRYGERVAQDWDLKAFFKNPVVLWAHSSRELPIGRGENVRVEDGALQGTIRFASATANPVAEQCFQLFREEVLNAVSVGFIPHSYKFEKENDKEVLVLSQNELIELSCTPVPANPEALAKMRSLALRQAPKQTSLPFVGANQETPDMDLEQKIKDMETSAAKSAEAIATTQKALDMANGKVVELQTALAVSEKSLTDEKASTLAAEKRAKIAEDSVVRAGVLALVGKKLDPAEVEEFIELALSKPELYEKMIAKRHDLPTAVGTVVIAAERSVGPAPVTPDANGDALLRLLEKSASEESDAL
jgi:HK97 family phage prohead protease